MMQRDNTILGNPLLRASGIVFVGSMAANVVNYLFNVVMGRMLTPADFGTAATVVTLTMLIGPPAAAITMLLAKRLAILQAQQKNDEIGKLYRTTNRFSWRIGLTGGVIFALLAPLLANYFHTPVTPFFIFSLVFPASLLAASGGGALQGLGQFGPLSWFRSIAPVSRLMLAVVFVLLGWSVSGVVLALAGSTLISYWYARFKTRSLITPAANNEPTAVHPSRLSLLLTPAVGFIILVNIIIAVFNNIDVVLMKHYLSSELAGQYSALAILGRIITYGSTAIVTVLLPTAAAAHALDQTQSWRLLKQALAFVTATAAAVAAIFWLAPDMVVKILLGAKYLSVAPSLGLFGSAMLLGAVSLVLINYGVATQRHAFIVPCIIAALVLIILLILYHASLHQIASMQLIANIVLLVGIAGSYLKRQPLVTKGNA